MADFEQRTPPPAKPVLTALAKDVYRVTVPVPFRALRDVNCYLLRGPEGWDVVDTGLKTRAALAAWQNAFTKLGIGNEDIHQIILTHHHPDHMGLAGHFQQAAEEGRRQEVPVRMSMREKEIITIIWGSDRTQRDQVMQTFFAHCGLPNPAETTFSTQELDSMRRMLSPSPRVCANLIPGEHVEIGNRSFEIIHTPGHSDGHLMFYDRAAQLLLAGDHVLPHITPNISLWPNVEPDPLGRYMTSLGQLKTLDVERAFPGHGDVITTWSDRVAALKQHHEDRLEHMYHTVGSGATVLEVSEAMFRHRTLDRHQLRMAVTETLAHLDHLVYRGRLRRWEEQAWWYEVV